MSSTASVTILLALAAAPLVGGPGRAGHLPPVTAKYRIDQTLNQEIDASGRRRGEAGDPFHDHQLSHRHD